MAIKDLLWACPTCGAWSALTPARRGWETCAVCGTSYRRGGGSRIVVQCPAGRPEQRSVADLTAALPPVPESDPSGRPFSGLVTVRRAQAVKPLRRGRRLWGWFEVFGPEEPGHLILYPDRLTFASDLSRAGDFQWPLSWVTAVQASSRTLQLKARSRPVLSFRFLEASARLWEERLILRLRSFYRERGLGEILEFQPRIRSR